MRRRAAACVLVAVFASACERRASTTRDHAGASASPAEATELPMHLVPVLANDLATRLSSQFAALGATARPTDNTVNAAGHELTVRVRPVHIESQGPQWVAALDVTIDLDGTPVEALHLPAIGIAASSDDAFYRAVREWTVSIGRPFAAALLSTSGTTTYPAASDGGTASVVSLPIGPMIAFAGPTGVRGDVPESWVGGTPAFHTAVLAQIAPRLDQLVPPANRAGFHSLKFVVHVRDGAAGEALCRVDGRPDDVLCAAVRTYPWPRAAGEYNVNQLYVLIAPPGR